MTFFVLGKINKVDLGTAEILTHVTGTTEEVLRMIETTGDRAKTIVTIAVSKMIVTIEVGRMTYVVEQMTIEEGMMIKTQD